MNKLPYVRTLHKLNSNSKFPAGHYYSTVVSIEDIVKRQDEIWKEDVPEAIDGIDLNTTEQLNLLKELSRFYQEIPFTEGKQVNTRYYFNNSYYSFTDGIILHSIIRYFRPSKIIEIGSGYSSAVMLDTIEIFPEVNTELTFIEPFSKDRLDLLLKPADRSKTEILEQDVQQISLDRFRQLRAGDILFVDSTHAVKTGSDVNYILFEILPVLGKGVLIHFHDIHHPFEYPKSWVLDGFGWNESYFVRAFLMYNTSFEIIFFSDYLHKYYKEAFKHMPLCYKSPGSNLWLKKK